MSSPWNVSSDRRLRQPLFTLLMSLLVALCASSPARAAQFTGDGAPFAKAMHPDGPAGPAINVVRGPCPSVEGTDGCWEADQSMIYAVDRPAFAHEMGHAFDSRNLNDIEREAFSRSFGFPAGTPWVPERGDDTFCDHIACPNETFADLYMGCALHIAPLFHDIDERVGELGYWSGTLIKFRRECRMVHAFSALG